MASRGGGLGRERDAPDAGRRVLVGERRGPRSANMQVRLRGALVPLWAKPQGHRAKYKRSLLFIPVLVTYRKLPTAFSTGLKAACLFTLFRLTNYHQDITNRYLFASRDTTKQSAGTVYTPGVSNLIPKRASVGAGFLF